MTEAAKTQDLVSQATKLEREQKYAEALVLFQQLRRGNRGDVGEILFHCGWCLERLDEGNRRRALRYYGKASQCLPVSPSLVNTYFRMGWLAFHDKDYAAASPSFLRAIDEAERIHLQTDLYHNSVYWYAVSLESQGLFLEALKWYRLTIRVAPLFEPEARYREICCLNQIGEFEDALIRCHSFHPESPSGFDTHRYEELRSLVEAETTLLIGCLTQRTFFKQEGNVRVSP